MQSQRYRSCRNIRFIAAWCIAALLFPLSFSYYPVQAASRKTFLIEQACAMALSNSSDYKKVYNKILMQQIKYVQAVRALAEKQRDMATFRWTPLLKFKFPEKADLTQALEFKIKPLEIQTTISALRHQLNDLKYESSAAVSIAYIGVYVFQEKIAYTQERLADAQATLERNRVRLKQGDASRQDVAAMETRVDTLTQELTQLMKNFEGAKKNLSELTGIDVTVGYQFKDPLKTAGIPRTELERIIQYTIANDQSCYEAKLAAASALTNMNTCESLMSGQYGGKMNGVKSYVSAVRNGWSINQGAFRATYDWMLIDVDKPWSGKKRILFVSFSKEWFKGQIDGIRYVEDEPYALYTAVLEYESARKDKESVEKAVRKQVSSSYEALLAVEKSYQAMKKTAESTKADLERLIVYNKQGKAEYQEIQDKQDEYQGAQMEALDTLATYNELLYSFDRLTCQAATKYLKGESLSLETGSGGDSYAAIDVIHDPYYYIESRWEDMMFYFGVSIPDGFEPDITHYELWYEKTKIGERTPVNKQINHLALTYGESHMLTIRFFKDDTYVEECEIDTTVLRGPLVLHGTVAQVEQPVMLGTYKKTTNPYTSITVLTFSFSEEKGVGYYRLVDANNQPLYTQELIPAEDDFTYLSILENQTQEISIELYDKQKTKFTQGTLQDATLTVMEKKE